MLTVYVAVPIMCGSSLQSASEKSAVAIAAAMTVRGSRGRAATAHEAFFAAV